jgi:hypothetical protein
MKKLAILFVAGALAFGQDKGTLPPAPLSPGEVVRVVGVKNGDASNIYYNLARIFPGISIVGNNLIVRGQPAVVDTMEDAIKKLDVPSPEAQPARNVELTVQLLLGSAQEVPDAKVPADLESTVRQLRSLFPYKSYRVRDTWVLRGRENERQGFNFAGVLPGTEQRLQLRVQQVRIAPGGAPHTITLQNLNASFNNGSSIDTSLDAREGQKTVVGKSNLLNSEDAIIFVITPRVLE